MGQDSFRQATPTRQQAPIASRRVAAAELEGWADRGVLYAVIDACGAPAVPTEVEALGPDRGCCLFRGWAAENFRNKAPYIAQLDRGFAARLAAEPSGRPWGILLASRAGFAAVRHHLRRFLTVHSPTGEPWLFRYYDPRLLPVFLRSCTAEELDAFFGPIDAFVLAGRDGTSYAAYRTATAAAPATRPAVGERFRLRDAHLAAFRRKNLGDALLRSFAGTPQTAVRETKTEDILLTDRKGHTTRLSFDRQGFVGGATSPLGRRWRLTNDPDGRLLEFSLPSGSILNLSYDATGRLARVARDGEERFRAVHDEHGRLQALGFPDGSRASIQYRDTGSPGIHDEAGRFVTALTDRLGRTERFTYDEDELAALTDDNGATTRFEYGQWRRPDAMVYQDGSREGYRYDPQGRLRAILLPGDVGLEVTCDDAGHVTRLAGTDGSEASFQYDAAGRLVAARNALGEITFAYDGAGRLVEERQGDAVMRYAYDESGTLVGFTYPTGETIGYERDADLRLTAITDWTGRRYRLEYARQDSAWRLISPEGLVATARQGPAGHTTSLRVERAAELLFETAYSYDSEDRLRERADSRLGIARYEYDAEGQLLAVYGLSPGASERFAYDGAGNRVRSNGQAALHNALNQLLAQGDLRCTYDERGNLVERRSGAACWRYRYDLSNRLVLAEQEGRWRVRYGYDALGRRVRKESSRYGPAGLECTTSTRYVWAGEHLIREVGETARHGGTVRPPAPERQVRDYLYWPQSHVPLLLREAGRVYQYHTDHSGVPRRLTDTHGGIVWEADYAAFGEARIAIGQVRQPWRLTGQYEDEETGLHYNRFRYYDPRLGRYTSRDPVSYLAGLNLYRYCGNDPINYGDPLGLLSWKTIAVVAASVAVGALVVMTAPISGPLLLVAAGAAAGAVGFGLNEALNQEHFCLSCILGAALKGAVVGALSALPFLLGPVGIPAFIGAGMASGAISYTATCAFTPGMPWDWGDFAQSVALGGAFGALGGVINGSGGFPPSSFRLPVLQPAYAGVPVSATTVTVPGVSVGTMAAAGTGAAVGGGTAAAMASTGGGGDDGKGDKGGHQTTVPQDVYIGGNKTAPRPPRIKGVNTKPNQNSDLIPDAEGNLEPGPPDGWPDGASSFADKNKLPSGFTPYKVPAGTELPEGLGIRADGKDVGGPHGPTHHTIYPTRPMSAEEFLKKFGEIKTVKENGS
ncbi:DUF4123 domain-containing protein [Belnapia sp. T6]|uniref:DUF4123 domain-containing protein n=1 Tax=Belnapia mucosa TaxID=2804532 RepID=A0ABS1VE22_9PROT|nr:DUF4123 domain-containing protein [Belnapia mucosa]MBL6458663.1 DUF4123 domain-containing protein [Belnapia mucosa]